MNKVILMGRLTKKPEIRVSQINNTKVSTFCLAVDRRFSKQGEERQTDFINIVAYLKLADFIEKYLDKGSKICLSGRLQIRTWEDDTGKKHYVSEVVAEEIEFAESQRQAKDDVLSDQPNSSNIQEDGTIMSDDSDDLPF